MYEVIKNVILSGRYELADMLTKIDTMWVQGDLAGEQREELVTLAREHANPENSHASLQNQIDALFLNYGELATELKGALERITVLEGGAVEPVEPAEWPEYVQPTGAHDAYETGDKVTFEGERYLCVAPEGTSVVWSPSVMPSYWQKAAEEKGKETATEMKE